MGLHKYSVYGNNVAVATEVVQELSIRLTQVSLMACGAPIGIH
jgi:hypothetical protein